MNNYFNKRQETLAYVEDDIKAFYFENIVAWTLDNCDITSRASIPHIFGDGTPIQTAFEDYIMYIMGKETA